MSLLTEEQIKDLCQRLSNDSNRAPMLTCIRLWNDKQPSPIEPNWKSLPSKVKYCHLRHYYFDANGNEIDWQFIISHARPIAAHPHAELMLKYAEVAARRVDPWVEFQVYSDPFSYWVTLEAPTFFDSVQRYRHIGDDK